MKKVVSLVLCCLMVMAAGAFPVSADFQESVNFSFDEAEHGLYDSSNGITPYASGLLTAYKLTIGTKWGQVSCERLHRRRYGGNESRFYICAYRSPGKRCLASVCTME